MTNRQRFVSLSLPSAEKVVHFLLSQVDKKLMALHFVGEKKICALHDEYFNDSSCTDCITFPYDDPVFLGEVFVCPKTAYRYVEEHGGDLYDEITLYVIHGFLHLLGFEDQTLQGKQKMRIEEKKWIKRLEAKNLKIKP